MALCFLVTAASFAPNAAPVLALGHRASAPVMSAQPMNRRSAVLSAAAAAAALPLMARAEIYQGGTSLGMKSDKDYLAGSVRLRSIELVASAGFSWPLALPHRGC
jgi:hypothetical protein